MGVAHVRLVHCDPCKCKVKGFHAVSLIERNVSKEALAKGAIEGLLSELGHGALDFPKLSLHLRLLLHHLHPLLHDLRPLLYHHLVALAHLVS